MIKIINAYENNLKNISLEIPINKITSIIGVSGSGKSSLIYNVIANEAKRREKIDSGNANCLDFAIRPKFDKIENLPYVVVLKQRGIKQSISSTIATYTGLHELLREEFVKYGKIISDSGKVIKEPTFNDIKLFIKRFYNNKKYKLFAVVAIDKYTDGKEEIKLLKKYKVKEAIFISSFNNKEVRKKINNLKTLNPEYSYTILVPLDIDDLEKFKELAKYNFLLRVDGKDIYFYYNYPDIETGKLYYKKTPELFSFNSTAKYSGRCKYCNGHGKVEDIDWNNLINNKKLKEHFLNIEVNEKDCYKYILLCKDTLEKIFRKEKIDVNKTFFELEEEVQKKLKDFIKEKLLRHKARLSIAKFIKTITCPECKGSRLNYQANAVKLFGKSISELLSLSVDELYEFFKNKDIKHRKILDILFALKKATLDYLTLDRTTDTLSGGELQRLKFAVELIGEYKNLLYILDEPSTGLHPYNNKQMIELIKELRDKENTIIISEHNIDYIKNSDFIVELGPGSGERGGYITFTGNKKDFPKESVKRKQRKVNINNSLKIYGVNVNNIKNENFVIPLNCLVAITGISGSGKSSLIHKALVPTLNQYLINKIYDTSVIRKIEGIEKVKGVIELTQSQIGKNSRSIVATYLNIFDEIRDIFASSEEAKELNLNKSYFSFNSEIGACEECKGLGEIDDGTVCPSCLGSRYKPEVLEVRVNGLNISQLLNLSITQLKTLFNNKSKKLEFALDVLEKLGLSYITLGRVTTTLSGGEAQRLRLSKVLIESLNKIKKGGYLFIFDEPTTGLNIKDLENIYTIFNELLSYGNSLIVIEHNLDLIKNSDFIVDIGIGSGKNGGKNIFSGTYEELLKNEISLTAKAFRGEFERTEKIPIYQQLKEKKYNTKFTYECHPFYLNEVHFDIEKNFAQNYEVFTDSDKNIYFKSKDKLFSFVKNLKNVKIYFNPYTAELFKYKKVPLTIKKSRINSLKKLGFNVNIKDYNVDEWDYRVFCENLEKAYNFGKGWITVETNNGEKFELFTRLVSPKNKIIGSANISEYTFNLYLNSCIYCHGKGFLFAYENSFIIKDETKSILDKDFLHFNINLKLKAVVNKFLKENLFDFSKPFSELNEDKKNIFLFGFKEYEFLKHRGRSNAKSDYIRWEGLYRYIFLNLEKIPNGDKIIKSKHKVKCPFCSNGFKKEVEFYHVNGSTILDIIESYNRT